jgi:hypothetical protein
MAATDAVGDDSVPCVGKTPELANFADEQTRALAQFCQRHEDLCNQGDHWMIIDGRLEAHQ